jgi:hypothetical protein
LLIKSLIEWDNPASFHTFFPKSDKFQTFVSTIKPFAAAPAIPELYEAEERSIDCTSSPMIQIFKVKASDETERAWEKLKEGIKIATANQPSFYHANGIEKDDGTFLGLIGWNSSEVCTYRVEQKSEANSKTGVRTSWERSECSKGNWRTE